MRTTASRTIPKAVQRAVLARDGLFCRYCAIPVSPRGSGPARPDELHFDHVKPWGAGGEHSVENIVASCRTCNLGRDKPTYSIRREPIVLFHHSRYWWAEGVHPPVLARNVALIELGDFAASWHRSVGYFLHRIMRGVYGATDDGGPIYIDNGL